jgi:hypothetical protein
MSGSKTTFQKLDIGVTALEPVRRPRSVTPPGNAEGEAQQGITAVICCPDSGKVLFKEL